VWVLSNRKDPQRVGKVQLIDASGLWTPMRKSLGDKRREIAPDQIAQIIGLFEAFEEGERSKIFPTSAFGYRKITIERPLRLNFQASAERISRLQGETAFRALALSKKKDPAVKAHEEALGRAYQSRIVKVVQSLGDTLYRDRAKFERALAAAARRGAASPDRSTAGPSHGAEHGVAARRGEAFLEKPAAPEHISSEERHEAAGDQRRNASPLPITAPIRKAILSALSERDETAEICRNKAGQPEPDTALRDTENVPLGQDVFDYFAREVQPHVPDAWVNRDVRDKQDGQVGKVGYEINFNRYFYTYVPPRPLAEIEADIRALEGEIMAMLREVTR
jgi:type I restriction enzyme M protein